MYTSWDHNVKKESFHKIGCEEQNSERKKPRKTLWEYGVLQDWQIRSGMVLTEEEYRNHRGKMFAMFRLFKNENVTAVPNYRVYFRFLKNCLLFLLRTGQRSFNNNDRFKCEFVIRKLKFVENALIRTIAGGQVFPELLKRFKSLLAADLEKCYDK